MMIFADSGRKNEIPSTIYMRIADFSVILDDIKKGAFPTGSQKPYPVFPENYKEPTYNIEEVPPWK